MESELKHTKYLLSRKTSEVAQLRRLLNKVSNETEAETERILHVLGGKLREAREKNVEMGRKMEEEEEDMVNGLLRKLQQERSERLRLEERLMEEHKEDEGVEGREAS